MDACHALQSYKLQTPTHSKPKQKKAQFTNATKPCKVNHENLEIFH
jgi:hypothetical protein